MESDQLVLQCRRPQLLACVCSSQLERDATFGQQHVDAFTELTGDSNPLHRSGAELPLVPGLLAASLFPSIIGTRFPGVLYTKQELTFRSPVAVCASSFFRL